VQEGVEFFSGKTYSSFFDRKDAELAARMVRELATPDAWLLLRHYFEGLLDDSDGSPKLLLSNGDDKVRSVPRPEVAWLISFPNSVSEVDASGGRMGHWDISHRQSYIARYLTFAAFESIRTNPTRLTGHLLYNYQHRAHEQ
jgi:hypothetical protein